MLEGEGCVVPMLCCFIEGEKPFMVQLLLPQMCRKEVGHHLRDVKSSKEEEGSTRKRVKRENLIPVEGDEDDEVFSLAPIHRESLHGCSCDYREADERKPLDEAVNSREQQESLSAEIDDGALHGQQVYGEIDEGKLLDAVLCNAEEKDVFSARVDHETRPGYVEGVSNGGVKENYSDKNDHESVHSCGYEELDEGKLVNEGVSNGEEKGSVSAGNDQVTHHSDGNGYGEADEIKSYGEENEVFSAPIDYEGCHDFGDLVEGVSFEEEKEGCPVQNVRDRHVYGYREPDKIKIDEEYFLDKCVSHGNKREVFAAQDDEDQHSFEGAIKPSQCVSNVGEDSFTDQNCGDSHGNGQRKLWDESESNGGEVPFRVFHTKNDEDGHGHDQDEAFTAESGVACTAENDEDHHGSNQDQCVEFKPFQGESNEGKNALFQSEEAYNSSTQAQGSSFKPFESESDEEEDEAFFQNEEARHSSNQDHVVRFRTFVEKFQEDDTADMSDLRIEEVALQNEEAHDLSNQDQGTRVEPFEGDAIGEEPRHSHGQDQGTRKLKEGETNEGKVEVIEQEDGAADTSYLPGLDDSAGLRCLAFVPVSEHWRIKSLSTRHRRLVSSLLLLKLRQEYRVTEQWICIYTSGNNGWTAFDPKQNTWRSLPHANVNPNFDLSDKESFSAGSHLLWLGREAFDFACYKYDLVSNSWGRGPPMVNPRCLFASASCGHYAFVAGGFTVGGMQFNVLNTAERYDSMKGVWEPLPDMATPRHKCSGFFMDGKFYVIGGKSMTHEPLTSGEEYDPEKNVWRTIENMYSTPPSTPSFEPSPPLVAVAGNELYAIESSNNLLKVYRKESNTWKVLGPVPVRADFCNGWGLAFKALGNELFVIGGHRVSNEEREGVAVFSWRPQHGASAPEWQLVNSRVTGTGNFLFNCAVMAC